MRMVFSLTLIIRSGLYPQIPENKWRGIFNPNQKRHQCKELKYLNFKCMEECVRFLGTVNAELQARQWVALRTMEGAQRQYSHTNYNPQDTKALENNKMPLLAFIPLEDNTQLYIWNPSKGILNGTYRNLSVKPLLLTVNRGIGYFQRRSHSCRW